MTRKEFTSDTKRKVLLWSDRHCCLCGKECGVNIEIVHLEDNSNNTVDNAMPLCFDCHAMIGHYNTSHPKGNKYKPEELKQKREAVYDQYTSHLVPMVQLQVPRIIKSNNIAVTHLVNQSNDKVATFTVEISVYVGKDYKGLVNARYYNGDIMWYLRAGESMRGNFPIEKEWYDSKGKNRLRFEVNITVQDIYGRNHVLAPYCYANPPGEERMYFEPTSIAEIIKGF